MCGTFISQAARAVTLRRAARARSRSTARTAAANAAPAAIRVICQPGMPPMTTGWAVAGDYPAAEASLRLVEDRNRDLGDRYKQAWTRSELAMLQQLIGDYRAAEASHEQALRLYRDLGQRREQAEVLNSLGELSSRCAAGQQACHYYNQALTIAREVGAPLEEARALEGLGRCHLQDGRTREGTAHLQQALTIYQRVGEARALRTRLASERGSATPGASALTAAELRLLPLLLTHLSFPEIAAELFLSPCTIKSQATSVYRKLGASSRSQAVALAQELALLEG